MKVKLQDTKTGIDLSKLEVGVEYIFILRNGTKITDKLQRREQDDIYPYSVGWFTAYMKHGNYYLGNRITGLDIVKIKQKVKKTQI